MLAVSVPVTRLQDISCDRSSTVIHTPPGRAPPNRSGPCYGSPSPAGACDIGSTTAGLNMLLAGIEFRNERLAVFLWCLSKAVVRGDEPASLCQPDDIIEVQPGRTRKRPSMNQDLGLSKRKESYKPGILFMTDFIAPSDWRPGPSYRNSC